ncbi:hypothetical protein GIB67_006705 [Kingdonia uniflora]|uniref:RRM domain-containing protein n=1 Tax=Kingdonia uniflora TaxID=39325 RepID=A0A7J7LYS2_9MAGN|nr:hypothetical protein GIB67_006705 [Kingdonia uniflora]
MGAKGRTSTKKRRVKTPSSSKLSISASRKTNNDADFLPLEGGPARKLPFEEPLENTATVLYIGRIPHGFYENEMEGFFKQFGMIKRLRIARSKKTGKSKHFGFIEFESPEVAKIVSECMHNYLLFEHMLQVHLVPQERVHPKLWHGVTRIYKPVNWTQIERTRHNKERTIEQHNKLVVGIMNREKKRRKRIEAAGIDYECPEILGSVHHAPKKIKFTED